jgi:dTDP-4-amino-4,6-dideoxygalactose transaminase
MIGDEEKKAVLETLNSPLLVHGPKSAEFEEDFTKFIGGGSATSTSSATTALQLAYMSLGIGVGDEVIVTSLTHVATANSILSVGATPVFVDIDTTDANISVESVRQAVTDKTKAICVVHYLGRSVDMSEIMKIAELNNLYVIEDCALALGSKYEETHVGLIGDFGAFSFYPAKHITTGEGGMLISKNFELIAEAAKRKAFYYDKGVGERKTPGVYDIVGFGLNFRMSEIAASLGIVQLRKLPQFLKQREENSKLLVQLIHGGDFGRLLPTSDSKRTSSYYCASFVLNEKLARSRGDLISRLKEFGIVASVYYPVAIPDSTYYSQNRDKSRFSDHTQASQFAKSNIAIGIGPHLSKDDIIYLAEKFNLVLKEFS